MTKTRVTIRRDDRGSLVIAVAVLMIIGLLGLAIVTRATGTQRSAARTQDFAAALSAADAGVTDAAYRIELGELGTLQAEAGTGDGTFRYVAEPTGINSWLVTAQGEVDGVLHGVQTEIVRTADYPYAIWAEQELVLPGNCENSDVNGVSSYDSAEGEVPNTRAAYVGSGGDISSRPASADKSCADRMDYYSGGTCNVPDKCNLISGEPPTYDPPTEPESDKGCPIDGSATVSTALVGGGDPYYCALADLPSGMDEIVFSPGVETVVNATAGPVIFQVGDGVTVQLTGAFVNLNTDFDPDGLEMPAGGRLASDFRLLIEGDHCGNENAFVDFGTGSNIGWVNGVVYSPGHSYHFPGSDLVVASLVGCTVRFSGNPNLGVLYDEAMATEATGPWEIRNWSEVPSGTYDQVVATLP